MCVQTFGEHVLDYEEATSFSRAIQTALYYCCDVLLHTPVQEVGLRKAHLRGMPNIRGCVCVYVSQGMNLLPLEYVYCRTEWSRAVEVLNRPCYSVFCV